MNRLNYGKLSVFAAALALVATSCKKDVGEFPKQSVAGGTDNDFVYDAPVLPGIKDADGIIAAVEMHNYRIEIVSPFEKTYQYGMAEFTNTTGNFSVLTGAGAVVVDTSNLTANASGLYQSYPTTYSLNFGSNNTAWSVSGAGGFAATAYTVPAGQPSYSLLPSTFVSYWKDEWVPTAPRTLVIPVLGGNTHADSVKYATAKQQYHTDSLYNATPCVTLPVKNYVANTDTMVVLWHDDAGYSYYKKVPATDSLALITPNDFGTNTNYSITSNFKMEISLVKYHPVMSGSKKLYFIRMSSYVKYWRTQ